MVNVGETHEREVTVGFRVPEYLIDIVDILCKQEDLNRSEFLRRALGAYEPMRSAIAEFDQRTSQSTERSFSMTPDWAYEKLLLERRIKFLELVGRRFHLFGPDSRQKRYP